MKLDDVTHLLSVLDYMDTLLSSFTIEKKILDLLTLNSRYYIALHDILLPVIVKDSDDGIPKVLLTPYTTVYIYEQKIYAITKNYVFYTPFNERVHTCTPAIDLSENENLLILASSALAHKIVLTPSERNIVRIMPSNIRTYIDAALKIMENLDIKSLKNFETTSRRTLNIVEFILWLNEAKDDNLKEVRYFKGLTLKIFKILYSDHELDLKAYSSFSSGFITKFISILPRHILSTILSNVESAYKIATTSFLMNR